MPEAVVAPRTHGTASFGGLPEGAVTAAIDYDSNSSQDGNSEDGEANIAPDGFREGLFYESDDDIEPRAAIEVPGAPPYRVLPWVRQTLVPWKGCPTRRGVALQNEDPNIPPFTADMAAPFVRRGCGPLDYLFMFLNLFIPGCL